MGTLGKWIKDAGKNHERQAGTLTESPTETDIDRGIGKEK